MRLTDEQLEGMAMWDDAREVMFTKEHQAVGALLVKCAVAEIREHRTTMERLREWADQLERDTLGNGSGIGIGSFIACELRNRLKGSVLDRPSDDLLRGEQQVKNRAAQVAAAELTYEQCKQAAAPYGVDLGCAKCAAVFYTGVGAYGHEDGCTSRRHVGATEVPK